MSFASLIAVDIPSTSTNRDQIKTFTQFDVVCSIRGDLSPDEKEALYVDGVCVLKPWTIKRRYSDFLSLHRILKQKFPEVTGLVDKFPPKRNWNASLKNSTIEMRRQFFITYLNALMELAPRPADLNQFLEIPQNLASQAKALADAMGTGSAVHRSRAKAAELSGVSSSDKTLEDFELLYTLGKGAFGKVFLVRTITDDNKIYALKVLKKEEVVRRNQVEHTITERRVMGAISHPFICTLRYAFQTKNKLFMVSDFCQGGELFFHLKKMKHFDESMVRFYSSEIVLAFEHLHSHGIVYRDVKPENVLLDGEGHLKITDFGLSKMDVTEQKGAKTFCGTPEYLAPEVILNRWSKTGYGMAVNWGGSVYLLRAMSA